MQSYAYETARGLTLKDAKLTLRQLGMSINKNQYGEYRVNFLGGDEATAYYTNDLNDAVMTGKHMAGVKPPALRPNPYDENPMSKGTKTALIIGGGVAVLGVAAYFLLSKSSTRATGATGGTGGTQTGGVRTGGTNTGGTGPSGYHFVGPAHPFPINYFGPQGGQPQGQQGNQPQPVPTPVVVKDGDALSYQAPAANSLLLVQLPQWCSPTNVLWNGSGSLSNLGPTSSGGVQTVQLIMPGGAGTLTINWTDNSNNNAPGSATIALS